MNKKWKVIISIVVVIIWFTFVDIIMGLTESPFYNWFLPLLIMASMFLGAALVKIIEEPKQEKLK